MNKYIWFSSGAGMNCFMDYFNFCRPKNVGFWCINNNLWLDAWHLSKHIFVFFIAMAIISEFKNNGFLHRRYERDRFSYYIMQLIILGTIWLLIHEMGYHGILKPLLGCG